MKCHIELTGEAAPVGPATCNNSYIQMLLARKSMLQISLYQASIDNVPLDDMFTLCTAQYKPVKRREVSTTFHHGNHTHVMLVQHISRNIVPRKLLTPVAFAALLQAAQSGVKQRMGH